MYGTCQRRGCSKDATHTVKIVSSRRDMYVCPEHADYYERQGYRVEKIG